MRRRCVISPCHSNYSIELSKSMNFIRSQCVISPCRSSCFKAINVTLYPGKLHWCSCHGCCRWYHHRHRDGLSPQEPENRCEKVLEAKIGGVLDIYHVICQHKLHSGQDHNIFHQYRTINQVRFQSTPIYGASHLALVLCKLSSSSPYVPILDTGSHICN